MSDERSVLLEAVADLARTAGDVAMRRFKSNLAVERKADGSPVTAADRAAEQCAREWIAARFPDDGVVGEELGAHRAGARRRWLVDPIDGTQSFIHGVPLWGTLIAVCEANEVIAGAACFPALGELVAAAVERGAWWNGARCAVSTVPTLDEATVLTTDHRFSRTPERREGWRRLASRAALARDWGDCYGYLLVATGRADVMIDGTLADWDAAPLFPVIREAGGVFTTLDGGALDLNTAGVLAGTPALHAQALALFTSA